MAGLPLKSFGHHSHCSFPQSKLADWAVMASNVTHKEVPQVHLGHAGASVCVEQLDEAAVADSDCFLEQFELVQAEDVQRPVLRLLKHFRLQEVVVDDRSSERAQRKAFADQKDRDEPPTGF